MEDEKIVTETPAAEAAPAEQAAPAESMDDYKEEIDKSFKRVRSGDMMKGKVIGISDTALTVDFGSFTEGLIPLEECSNDPKFSIHNDIPVGTEVSVIVVKPDNGMGQILCSKKKADDILVWDELKAAMDNNTTFTVTISEAVKAGCVAFVKGIRGFIPASQLSLSYVENLSDWVGKTVDVVPITVDTDAKRLVISSKKVAKEKADAVKAERASKLVKGAVLTGKVETIKPYGAFIDLGDGMSGLVHISRMADHRIKTPDEVVKVGDEVTVHIVDFKDGKISLSMRDDNGESSSRGPRDSRGKGSEEPAEDAGPRSYKDAGGAVGTSLGDLLKGIKL